jgi:Ino eighty subunit 1
MFAGLLPLDYGGEVNDYGEEAYHRAKMLSRTLRRLERWESGREVVRGRKRSVEDEVEQKSESAGWALRNGDAAATRNGNGNGAGNGVPAAGPGRNGVAREQEEEKEDEDEEMQDVGDEDDDDDEQYTLPPLSSVV